MPRRRAQRPRSGRSEDGASPRRAAGRVTGPIRSVSEALAYARGLCPTTNDQKSKKNFAEALSRALATCFSNALRPHFPHISPDQTGQKQERRARTSKGFKKLDVNYSTVDLGLALGVSVKTINARDRRSGRYTKNYTRADAEFRAEATDYHRRQPFAVLVGVLFLPIDSCDDAATGRMAESGTSSFGAAVRSFRWRVQMPDRGPQPEYDTFELFFVGLYDATDGSCSFHDVRLPPARARRPNPSEMLTFAEVIEKIRAAYAARNDPPFEWA